MGSDNSDDEDYQIDDEEAALEEETEAALESEQGSGWESGFTSGYTTGGATTGDDSDDASDLFNEQMDPMSLLMDMEQCHAGQDGVDQPFELIRSRRADYRASRRRQRAADEEDDDDGVGGTAGGGDDADADAGAPSMLERKPRGRPPLDGRGMKGRGSGRPRGRPSRRELEDRDGVGAGGRGVFGASVDEIWEDPLAAKLGMNPRAKRRKKRKGKRSQEIPEEVSKKLGEANLMYAMSRYREAIELLTEVIKEYPKITDPYHTLGLIHEATGYSRKALDFYMIAAHLAPRDMPLWKRLAALSTEVGLFRQAIYCLSRVIRRSKGDLDALWDRAVLYAEVNELERALAQFEEVGRQRVGDPEVPKMIARLQHRLGLRQQAIETLEKHLQSHADASDLTHVNILSELYMEEKQFAQALALIERAERVMCDGSAGGEEMPLDLTVKAGLCLAHTGALEQCDQNLERLMGEPTEQYGDLYLDVGNAFMHMGQYDRAVVFLEALQENPDSEYNDPALWGRLLICYRALNDLEPVIQLYRKKSTEFRLEDPRYLEACVSLAEVLVEAGHREEASELLAELETQEGAGTGELLDAHPDADSLGAVLSGAPNARTALMLRHHKLHLQLGQFKEFVELTTPLMWNSLLALEKDIEFASGTADITGSDGVAVLPSHLKRALLRRKRIQQQGGRIGEGASETASVFKGAVKRDRRKSHVLIEDKAAEAFLSGLGPEDETGGFTTGGGATTEAGGFTTADEGDGGMTSDGGYLEGGARGGHVGPRQMLRRLSTILAGSTFMRDDVFSTFTTLCRALMQQGQHEECQMLINKALSLCTRKSNLVPRSKRDQLLLITADCLSASGQYSSAIHHLKGVCSRWPASCSAWSRYCQVSTLAGTVRSWMAQCAIMRKRYPSSVPLMLMLGHVFAISRQHTEALSEYFHAYRFWPKEPLLLLCIGVTYLNKAVTKKAEDRNRAVLQGFTFMQAYMDQRGEYCSQESLYNMGRAAHQLGLMHIALTYYKRALATPPPDGSHQIGLDSPDVSSSARIIPPHAYGLQREIAHNLAMLYRNSGADELAREVYRKYCVI